MAQTETYKLKFPVQDGAQSYTVLTIRRPKMRDVKKFEKIADPMEKSCVMITDLAELPPSAVDELDPDDFNAIALVIKGFFETAQE